MSKPLCIDVFSGLGGWSEGFIAEGYDVIGFDIERHVYGDQRYPGQLVIQDARTLHGSQFKTAACLVMSPPCQKYSYMSMPWTRSKDLARYYADADHPERMAELNELFNTCFRIQREASEAAGCHIPMVVENVRGAQKWVGPARWNCGNYYLWGDIPALMPPEKFFKVSGFRFDERGSFQTASVRRTDVGNGVRFTSRDCGVEKRQGWFNDQERTPYSISSSSSSSSSPKRKAASAMIAKIPFTLSQHIARTFKS